MNGRLQDSRLLDRILTLTAVAALPVIVLGLARVGSDGIERIRTWQTKRALVALADSLATALASRAIVPGREGSITVVEFTDYECPACKRADSILVGALHTAEAEVRIVVAHYPLTTIHPLARGAAIGALCAEDQGRFSAWHHLLFEHGVPSSSAAFSQMAQLAGIKDSAKHSKCLVDPAVEVRLDAEIAIGVRLGVGATPTFLTQHGVPMSLPELVRRVASNR
jgi:protein-disulfide isomerase